MSACERSRVKISTSGSSGAAASGADHPTRAVSGSTRCAAPCKSGRRVPAGRHRRAAGPDRTGSQTPPRLREFFTGDFPASTLVEVRSLAKPEVLVEIETVAYPGKS